MKRLKSQDGFSLIELTLSLLVATALMYTAVPVLGDAGENMSLDAAAKKMEMELRYAQSMAVTTLRNHGVETKTSTTSAQDYRVYGKSSRGFKLTLSSPYDHAAMNEDFSEKFGDVAFASDYAVEFDSEGRPTSGSATSIVITLPADGSGEEAPLSKTLSIDPETGNISID